MKEIEIVPYGNLYKNDVISMDGATYAEMECHMDVIKETAVVALADGRFSGVAYLCGDNTFQGIERMDLPEYHISFVIKALNNEDEVDVNYALMEKMKESFASIAAKHPGKRVVLRTWCNSVSKDYLEYLVEQGFSISGAMPVMANDLSQKEWGDIESLAPEDFTVEEFPFQGSPDNMKYYMEANERAFGEPAGIHETIFRSLASGAKIYCLRVNGKPVCFATAWNRGGGIMATETIFCEPDFRRAGYTTCLMQHVLDILEKQGFRYAMLSVYGDNVAAMNLYMKLGYTVLNVMLEMHYEVK